MPALSAEELEALRSQSPTVAKVTWYLALAPYGFADLTDPADPAPAFHALVNDAGIDRGDRRITYDNAWGEANVLSGMTLWVGGRTEPWISANNIGSVRIRGFVLEYDTGSAEFTYGEVLTGAVSGDTGVVVSWTVTDGTWAGNDAEGVVYLEAITGNFQAAEAVNGSVSGVAAAVAAIDSIQVAENEDIQWLDGLRISCPGQAGWHELWGVVPRITEVNNVVTFLEDYDMAWNAQDDVLPPKANAGPPACEFLGPGGYVDIAFTGDRSFTTEVGADVDSWDWDFADGEVGGVGSGVHTSNDKGTCINPVEVAFSQAGFRYVSLTVTDDSGRERPGTVYVPVWTFDDDHPPLLVQSIGQTGNPHWRLTVTAFASDDATTEQFYHYPDGALVVLFTVTEYPSGFNEVGGFCYRSNIRFVGWLEQESLSFDYNAGTVRFTAIDHALMANKLPGFAYTLEDNPAPSDWYEVDQLDIDRAVHAHLQRRSTINRVCHVEPLGDGVNRPVTIQAYEDGSVYAQVQSHLLDDAMAKLLCDRQGILRQTRDPQVMSAAQRLAVAVVCELDEEDWLNEIDQTRLHQDEVGYVRLGGFAGNNPLLSEAPSICPSNQEADVYKEGYLVENQAELNRWCGCVWTKQNNLYKSVPVELKGNWPTFDPAYQEYVQLTAPDPLDRNNWNAEDFVVREVTFRDSAKDGLSATSLVLEKANDIWYGTTKTVPNPPAPPSVPVYPPPGPTPPPNWGGALTRVILRTSQGIFITENFNDPVPGDVFWAASNNNLSANERQNIRDMAFDWSDGERLFMVCDHATDGGAYRCNDVWNQDPWDQRFDNDYAWQTIDAVGAYPCSPIDAGCVNPAGIWWAVGIDPTTGVLTFIAGYQFNCLVVGWNADGCNRHKRVWYSADSLDTITLGDHLLHDPVGGTCGPDHCSTVWAGAGSISSLSSIVLLSYSCAWATGSDRHRGLSADMGATVDTSVGVVFATNSHCWHTRVGSDVIFYTDQGIQGDDIAVSADDGLNFTAHADVLPDLPTDSGQALTMHFLDTGNVMMIDQFLGVHYSTDGGFTWAGAGAGPDNPYCIAACADSAWPIPDGFGYIAGANQPANDDNWVFLTRDLGVNWENRTGNLGDFLDHTVDIIYEIIPVQEASA
jgi:hypothetical protein